LITFRTHIAAETKGTTTTKSETQPQQQDAPERTWRSDKAHEVIRDAAERIANAYCFEDDTYYPEVKRLTVAISEAVDAADLPRATADAADKELIEAVAQPWICVEEKPCEEAVPVHWDEMITALAAMNVPCPVAQTPTVEIALAELREMFPHRDIQISWSGWSWQHPSKYFKDGYKAKIEIGFLKKFEAETLSDAMENARAWSKSRAQKEGERT
jgi:hypothetical protein